MKRVAPNEGAVEIEQREACAWGHSSPRSVTEFPERLVFTFEGGILGRVA